MKKYVLLCAAAAIVISSSGCAALETVNIDSENQAYSRVLYPDGDYYTDSEEDEEEPSEEKSSKSDKTEHQTEEKSKNNSKGNSKEKAKENKSDKSETDTKEEKSFSSSSSKAASSRSSSVKSSSDGSRKTASRSSYKDSSSKSRSSDSDRHSDMDKLYPAETDSDRSAVSKQEKPSNSDTSVYRAEFTLRDLTYNGVNDMLDFDDDEPFVRYAMGEPLEEYLSGDGRIKRFKYDDCIVTLVLRSDEDQYYLTDILVPYESYYETYKHIFTESSAADVLRAYGRPTRTEAVIPEQESGTPSEEAPESTETDSQTNLVEIGDTEDENISDTENDPAEESDTGGEQDSETDSGDFDSDDKRYEEPYDLYVYSIGDKSLIFTILNGEVVEIEYRWDIF